MTQYFKVVTEDLKSVGLLGATPIQYTVGEWTHPLEPLSNHPRKGGGLWVYRKRGAAMASKRYMSHQHGKAVRIFSCLIGNIIYETSYRVKTDKVMLVEEIS